MTDLRLPLLLLPPVWGTQVDTTGHSGRNFAEFNVEWNHHQRLTPRSAFSPLMYSRRDDLSLD